MGKVPEVNHHSFKAKTEAERYVEENLIKIENLESRPDYICAEFWELIQRIKKQVLASKGDKHEISS